MTDDDRLMILIQEGDGRAFEEIVERYQGPLWGFFFRNTRDAQLAEDLTQETLLKVFHQAWDYLPLGRFRGWMYRIGRNLLIDDVRRRSHDALIRATRRRTAEDDDQLALLAGEFLSPDTSVDHREVAALIDDALAEIPEEQRLTFTLHHYSGLPLADVAQIMETSLPTCKSRLRLAREKLSEKLRRLGVRPPSHKE